MNTSSPITPRRGYNFRNNSSIVEKSLIINEKHKKYRSSCMWGPVNLCLLSVLLYDIAHTCPINIAYILYVEYILAIIFFLNTIYHFGRLVFSLQNEAIPITPMQKQLLGVKDYDSNFIVTSPDASLFRLPSDDVTPNTSFSNTPMNMTAHSWRSNLSTSNNSPNYSLSSSSFSYVHNSPQLSPTQGSKRTSFISPLRSSQYDSSSVEFINDEQSLAQYLKGYEIYEKTANSSSPVRQPVSLLSSFWSHPAAKNNQDASYFFQKYHYQLSPLSSGSSSTSPSGGKSDDKDSPIGSRPSGSEILRQLHVDNFTLTQWNANIRMWISQTIVERLVKEIEHIDDLLQKQGLSDIRVGGVGLDRLRKTAQMAPVLQFIPTLSTLFPFLEISSNQEYLVKRIRELAKGGCMSDFKWNGGSAKEWNDSLPTDSALIMHLFVTYLDTQLLPLPNKPDIKPFSGYHYIKCTDKIPLLTPNTLAIHQISEKPPHYRVIVGEEILEIVKGYNNLLHTLLLFLYQVNKREHGMLGQINLGQSGVNILWVIDS